MGYDIVNGTHFSSEEGVTAQMRPRPRVTTVYQDWSPFGIDGGPPGNRAMVLDDLMESVYDAASTYRAQYTPAGELVSSETHWRLEGPALQQFFNDWGARKLVPAQYLPQFVRVMQQQLVQMGLLRNGYRAGIYDTATHDALQRTYSVVMPDEGFGRWTVRDVFGDQFGAFPVPPPGDRVSMVTFALLEALYDAWAENLNRAPQPANPRYR